MAYFAQSMKKHQNSIDLQQGGPRSVPMQNNYMLSSLYSAKPTETSILNRSHSRLDSHGSRPVRCDSPQKFNKTLKNNHDLSLMRSQPPVPRPKTNFSATKTAAAPAKGISKFGEESTAGKPSGDSLMLRYFNPKETELSQRSEESSSKRQSVIGGFEARRSSYRNLSDEGDAQ